MKTLLACSAVLLSLATTAHAAPAWCTPVEGKPMYGSLEKAITGTDPRIAIPSIIDMLCHSRQGSEEYARLSEVEAARQRMVKRLGMTEADWPDAAAWAAEHQGKLMSSSLDYDRTKAWSTLSPIEQFIAIVKDPDPLYVADIFGRQLTEAGRFGVIADCISRDNPVAWAVCQPDIEIFDRAKLRADLRASAGSSGYERMALRIDAFELEAKLVAHAARVKALIAKDPAYATVFQTAAAGRKRWSGTDEKLVDTVLALDDARATNSRRAAAGCREKTWGALRTAIGAIPAKTFAAAVDVQGHMSPLHRVAGIIANEPNGYLTALAYVMCKRDDGDGLTSALASAMARWPGFRGPRTTAVTAVMNAGIELDDRDAKLELPSISRGWIGSSGHELEGGEGVVAAVKVAGDQATITFAKKMAPGQRCTDWKTSNKIVMIRSDGVVIYDSWCVAYHKFTYDTAPRPQTVAAQYAEGVKPGMFVTISQGVVSLARASASAKLPTHVAGVPVR